MLLLIAFAFLAGIITVLSPCILPLLPIILSSSLGRGRPFGVVIGFVASFTFFTLFLSTIVRLIGIPADSLRLISIVVLVLFGLSLIIPQIQLLIEQLFVKLTRFTPRQNTNSGFLSGIIVGLSLGLLWTPCVGPILASVITLALTGTVNYQAFLITLAYATGTAIPMFAIMIGGQTLLQKNQWLVRNTPLIQKSFGVLMILTAAAIYFNVDRKFQTFILQKFPQYGTGLTKLEDNEAVRKQLEQDMNPVQTLAPELIPNGTWFNSEPLTLASLRGKVVLIDFWTYSCINCIRTLPYLRNWWDKYKDQGLVIIGVHTPEFEFEKDAGNLRTAISDFKLTYPIMQDNNYDTWRAYDNHYWPAKYLIDKDGRIRYTHFGEGNYDETEKVIQELLAETGTQVSSPIENPDYSVSAKTPEIYLGSLRNAPGKNYYTIDGDWKTMPEYANPSKGATLKLNFEAKEVFLVMRPKNGSGKVKVSIDGLQEFLGEDVKNGVVTVDSDRLYKLIKLPLSGKHTLQLEFLDSNVEVYAFTFG